MREDKLPRDCLLKQAVEHAASRTKTAPHYLRWSAECFGVFALPVDDASRQYVPLLHMNKERVYIYVVNGLNNYVLVILYLGLNESAANSR